MKNFQIKKDLPLIDKTHYNTSIGSFDIIPGMNFMKALGMTKFVFDSPIVQDGIIEVKKMESTYYDYVKIYSTTKFEDKAYYLVDDPADNVLSMESEIKQNTLGIYYLNSKIKEDNGAVKIVSQFFTKIDTSVSFIKVTFTMEKEDSELEKKYYQVLDTVALNGTFPFKSAAIGVVADASYTPRAVSLADHYEITIPSPTYVGEATDMTIKVLDASGAVVPDYIGTIYIVVDTDTGATIPYEQDGYTFTASDSGSIIIPKGLTFSQAGTMKLTVVDIDDDTLEGTTTVVVSPKR